MAWHLLVKAMGLVLLGITTVSVASAQTPLVWYKLNEGTGTTVLDSGSGTALNATLSGTATWTTSTPSGSGAALSIVDNATDANFASSGSVTGTKIDALTKFTITMWVNLQAVPTAGDRLLSTLSLSTYKGFDFNIQSVSSYTFTPTLLVDGVTGGAVGASATAVTSDHSWLFLSVSYDGSLGSSNTTFYSGATSGSLVNLGTASISSGAVDSSTGSLQVGNTTASTTDRTDTALFDDIRIYGSVLTSTEIDAIRMDAVPEPSTALLASLALAGFALRKLRARRLV